MMRIRINSALVNEGLSEASTEITKEERDHLFDVVVRLANFADDKGLNQVAERLEDVLDSLLEDEEGSGRQMSTNFRTTRAAALTAPRRPMPGEQAKTVLTNLKRARRKRLSVLR